VGRADTEEKPASGHAVDRECLLGEGHGVAGGRAHYSGSQLDPWYGSPDNGKGSERIHPGPVGDPYR
jgi:hypothetical protein